MWASWRIFLLVRIRALLTRFIADDTAESSLTVAIDSSFIYTDSVLKAGGSDFIGTGNSFA